ncbi:hypothetical protein EJB05_43586 [Eragrostis curvula]|uniref:Uncharacterized protein n=1 Tax=Eragrostis curvula TaxID=38414 RepID=A0A5J9TGS5_9POAL|nr:hypothetical protein EJB05_43586 [Eragrostis curvula]
MNPSMFLDAALGYAFYRLSVVSLKLRRQGLSNDLITRVKFVIMVIMAVNDFKNNLCLLDVIRMPVYFLYLTTFLYEVFGFKKYVKYFLGGVFVLLQIEEGREIIRDVLSELVPQSDNEL